MKYRLCGRITISVSTTVEANSLAEAIEIAGDKPNMDIINDSFYTEDDFWIAEELDGMVMNIREDV